MKNCLEYDKIEIKNMYMYVKMNGRFQNFNILHSTIQVTC